MPYLILLHINPAILVSSKALTFGKQGIILGFETGHIRSFLANRPFPSSPPSLFQKETKCEIFVEAISSIFNMNED